MQNLKSLIRLSAVAVLSVGMANMAQAEFLIGTYDSKQHKHNDYDFVKSEVESFSGPVDSEWGLIDKYEGSGFEESALELSDFVFYAADYSGAHSFTLAGVTQKFKAISGPGLFSTAIAGFVYSGSESIGQYAIKASGKWSLWQYMDGFNALYVDANGSLASQSAWDAYAKNKNPDEISHVSFFGPSSGPGGVVPVPLPASLVLVFSSVPGLAWLAYRKPGRSRALRSRRSKS